MMGIRIPSIGIISINLGTTTFVNGMLAVWGHDDDHNKYTIMLSKLSLQDDLIYECGWVRIASYTVNGVTTICDLFSALV